MKTKRYSDTLKTGNRLLELSFDGSDEVGKENPESTNVILRCLKKSNEVWVKNLGNIPMPDGAWHGPKLIAAYKNRFFVAAANRLMEVNIENGEVKWEIQTGNTPIYNVLLAEGSKQIIVRNGYYKFKHPQGMSNIAAYSFDGVENWRCKLEGDDVFANPPYFAKKSILHKSKLRAGTWQSFDCQIDENTGKILDREFTK